MKQRVRVMAKCDRCGKIMEKHDKDHYRILKVNAETTTRSIYTSHGDNWYAVNEKLELCQDCIASFKSGYINWLLAPKRKVKNRCVKCYGLINSHEQCQYYGMGQICLYGMFNKDENLNDGLCPMETKMKRD